MEKIEKIFSVENLNFVVGQSISFSIGVEKISI